MIQFLLHMKYRSRTDIVREILEAANGGATKTKIMYKAYLSYAQLQDYLSTLTESGLVAYSDQQSEYKTTEKGVKFLVIYNHMSGLTDELKQVQ
jgi:predicted transcriptional regulator